MICGITCNNKRYIYNGWIKKVFPDYSSCDLIEYDWLNNDGHFCLNTEECKLNVEIKRNELCFDVKKGYRIYLYVKISDKNIIYPTNDLENNNLNNNLLININNHDINYQDKVLQSSIWKDVRDLNVDKVQFKLEENKSELWDIRDKNFKGNLFTALSEHYTENMSFSTFNKVYSICKLLKKYHVYSLNGGFFPDILIKGWSPYDEQFLEIFKYTSIYDPLNITYKFRQDYHNNTSKECATSICLKMGNFKIIKIFFNVFAFQIDSKYTDLYGNNMLHIVSSRKNKDETLEIVKYIISKYPHYVNEKNNLNKTPYDLSIECNNNIPSKIYNNKIGILNNKTPNKENPKKQGFLTGSLFKIRNKLPFFKYKKYNNIIDIHNNRVVNNKNSTKNDLLMKDNVTKTINSKNNNLKVNTRNSSVKNSSKKIF